MSESSSAAPATPQGRPTTAGQPHGAPAGGPQIQRQFVSFSFWKLDPAFRRLSAQEKEEIRREYVEAVNQRREGLICLTYSTVGLRSEADFMLWLIGKSTDPIQEIVAALNKTRLAGYLTQPFAFLSQTKRSSYIDKLDPFHTPESRTNIIPGKRKYLFVYPFVKTRDWYLLPLEERQAIMDVHIKAGNEFPSIKLNTTYSFGLDDQDFVVAFETESPSDFLDLVMKLRETQSSKYTVRDTPIVTCVQMGMEQVLGQLF
ncbi:MAG TPA: chlorite dismutase family protein [Tepidisphaeraceae bacterium]|nr:chlorite dismutase family protein [Tepidisphaeraceae bacterium]